MSGTTATPMNASASSPAVSKEKAGLREEGFLACDLADIEAAYNTPG